MHIRWHKFHWLALNHKLTILHITTSMRGYNHTFRFGRVKWDAVFWSKVITYSATCAYQRHSELQAQYHQRMQEHPQKYYQCNSQNQILKVLRANCLCIYKREQGCMRTPRCFTPLVARKYSDKTLHHATRTKLDVYTFSNNLIMHAGKPRSTSNLFIEFLQ